ncbi:DUF4129 domain-containing protein [Nocardioides xinjiangensis]|uniref:DUF4129 domain-containing protein n=1 Tax=Nocardioides xinjiangensis TaxID=2817376 RepID=UPI001B30C53F|nr:DUF4129 domain-containing protein [Nocardioides sp. SYSU D00514]
MRAWGNRTPAARAVVAVTGTCLLVVLLAWATLLGPDQVFTGPGPRPATTTTTASCIPPPVGTDDDGTAVPAPEDPAGREACDVPAGSADGTQEVVERPPPLWVQVLAWLLLAALVAGVAALVLWLLATVLREVRVRRARTEERSAVGFAVLDEPVRVAEQVAADAAEQDAVLRDGDPRNAIVAAWHRFEVQGERAGVARRPSETSSEYAVRILDIADADTGSVSRLAQLYREARFSDHPVTESHRAEALAALAVLRNSLGVDA